MNNNNYFFYLKSYVVMKCLNGTYKNESFNLFIY